MLQAPGVMFDAAAGVERRSNAPLAGKEVHVINYCCDKLTQAQRDTAKQHVGEVLARNGAKQVAAPLRSVCRSVILSFCHFVILSFCHLVHCPLLALP
jgi:hypothetical protein